MPDHTEVVGDEDEGDAEVTAQAVEQVDDLGLDRHVEGGDRLVGNDDLRLDGEGPGDADALALAAGELGRVPVEVLRVQADRASRSWTRSFSLPLARPWTSSGVLMIVPTVWRGLSEP